MDDYDTPWKDALTRYLPEFLAYYFPAAHAAIDWSQPHTFLDQELAQVVREAELGKRWADRLVEVATHESGPQWVYIHIEVQGQQDVDFAERLFVYNYRLYDRYRRPVATLAVLADEQAGWKPERYGYELFGCRHYPYVTSVQRIGRQEGEAAMLLHQIEHKFGPPSDTVRERINAADADTLLRWSERILTAERVEEVLSG